MARSLTINFDDDSSFKRVLSILLESPDVDPNTLQCGDDSLIEFASEHNDVELLKFLLEDGRFDPTPALETACEEGNIDIVKILLNDSRTIIDKCLLHVPICTFSDNQLSVIKILLEDERINPNDKNSEGQTPFYVACDEFENDERYNEIVKILLMDDRVDPTIPCKEGFEPLYIACHYSNRKIVRTLLLDGRSDPNRIVKFGKTALHFACSQGDLEIVKILTSDERVDPHKTDDEGRTPFYYAFRNKHKDIIDYMMARYTDLVIPPEESHGSSGMKKSKKTGKIISH